MDISKVKRIITPAGELNKIISGGVVIWSKNTAKKYRILKNNAVIARVTIPDFIDQIHSGYAEENYGIGAQIIIPYTDSWNGKTYDLPFNFGTFTQYPSKLGLQTQYGIPSTTLTYGAIKDSTYMHCTFAGSYVKKWLNAHDIEHELTIEEYVGKKGFLGCLPEDFVEAISEEVKILSGIELFLDTSSYNESSSTYNYKPYSQGTNFIWEYWEQKLGTKQTLPVNNTKYAAYNVANRSLKQNYITTSIFAFYYKTNGGLDKTRCLSFGSSGNSTLTQSNLKYNYLPACYVG